MHFPQGQLGVSEGAAFFWSQCGAFLGHCPGFMGLDHPPRGKNKRIENWEDGNVVWALE